MWSVPLWDWLLLEAAGSSLGRAEPMAWQGGVLGLPGQQVKQSGESKALHTHKHTHPHGNTHTSLSVSQTGRTNHAHCNLRDVTHRQVHQNKSTVHSESMINERLHSCEKSPRFHCHSCVSAVMWLHHGPFRGALFHLPVSAVIQIFVVRFPLIFEPLSWDE